jgi:hypothetical protein
LEDETMRTPWLALSIVLFSANAFAVCEQERADLHNTGEIGAAVGSTLLGGVGGHFGYGGVGSMFGGLAGRAAGQAYEMDDYDQCMASAVLPSLRPGHSYRWSNPRTRAHITMSVPRQQHGTRRSRHQPEQQAEGCKEYRLRISEVNGKVQTMGGKACQRSDGAWDFS